MDVMRWWNAYFYTFIFNFKLFSPLWKFDNILWPTIYVSFPPNCSLNDNTFFVEQSSSWMLVLLHLHYIEPIDTFSIFNESFKRTHSNVCIHENVSCQNASCIQLTGAKYKFREVFITIFYFPLSFNVTFCSMSKIVKCTRTKAGKIVNKCVFEFNEIFVFQVWRIETKAFASMTHFVSWELFFVTLIPLVFWVWHFFFVNILFLLLHFSM